MGNQALERERRSSASPTKMAGKANKKVTVEEIQATLKSMRFKEAEAYIKGHHLLKVCSKDKQDELPQPGELVWARNLGDVYWPAFIAKMEDRPDAGDAADDIDDSAYTFVMFIEDYFRYAPVPWENVIPLTDSNLQKILIPKLNKVIKKSWKPSSMYKRSFDLIEEFLHVHPDDRQKFAVSEFKMMKEISIKKRETASPKKPETNDASEEKEPEKPPIKEEISKVISATRDKKKKGRRVSDRIVEKQIGFLKSQSKIIAKKKTETAVEDAEKVVAKNIKPKNGRPDVGGEVLKQWTKDRFDSISKQYIFESPELPNCVNCDGTFEDIDEIKYCHGMPHHANCLTVIDGEASTSKCRNCIELRCFLCKESSQDKKQIYKCTRCELRFHIDCLVIEWPQAEVQGSNGPITCPVHFCHSCLGEQKILGKCRDYTTNPSRAYKCLLCLSTYHKTCLPAGCGEDIKGKEFIICPKHKLSNLKVRQRRIGCLGCCKALKPKDERKVECQYCIQVFHPECVGYVGEICEKVSLEVFGKGYKCYYCRWGLFPLYGQVVWFQQPQSQFWPARILYPNEFKRRSFAKRIAGQYSVEYFGGSSCYDNTDRAVPLHLTILEVFKTFKVYQDTPKILRAHEEAAFFLQFAEKFRDTILQKPKPIYKKIERNVYRTTTVSRVKEPSDICSCCDDKKAELVCVADSGCTNRDMEMECSDRICKGGSRCANRMFSERKNDDDFLQQCHFPTKGWGVVAKKEFNPGDFVAEYRGEVIDRQEMMWRLNKKEEEDPMYILEISKEFFIDAEYVGNLSRLINHSCDPNSEIRKYLSQGKSVGGIFAKRKIAVGEEVTFDYGCGSQSTAPFRCRCGSTKCLVFVGKEVPEGFQAEDEDVLVNIDKWDDVCSKCGFGGRVICCEFPGCGKVWHYQCIGLNRPPRANWCCPEHPPITKKKSSSNFNTKSKTTSKVTTSRKSLSKKTENSTTQVFKNSSPKRKSSGVKKSSSPVPSTSSSVSSSTSTATTISPTKSSEDMEFDLEPPTQKTTTTDDSPQLATPLRRKNSDESSIVSQDDIDLESTTLSSPPRRLRSSKLYDSTESLNATISDTEIIKSPSATRNQTITSPQLSIGKINGRLRAKEVSMSPDITTLGVRYTRKRKRDCEDGSTTESFPVKSEELAKEEPSKEIEIMDIDVTPPSSPQTISGRRSSSRNRSTPRRNSNKSNGPFSPLALNSNLLPVLPSRERNIKL